MILLILPQISEKIEDNIDRLHHSLELWGDVLNLNEDIESWTSSCGIELNEILNNFSNSQKVSARLSGLQVRFSVGLQDMSNYLLCSGKSGSVVYA